MHYLGKTHVIATVVLLLMSIPDNAVANDPAAGSIGTTSFDLQDSVINLVQWTKAEGGNDHWYAVLPEPLTWNEARECAGTLRHNGRTGYLATITSYLENEFILSNVIHRTWQPGLVDLFWLGGEIEDGRWRWSINEGWGFTFWDSEQPLHADAQKALAMVGPRGMVFGGYLHSGRWVTWYHNSWTNYSELWSVVEWGAIEPPVSSDTITNLVQWTEAEGGNNHWYAVIPMQLYWDEARELAESIKVDTLTGYLATVTTQEENAFLVSNVLPDTAQPGRYDLYWLGGEYRDRHRFWITNERWQYTNWAIDSSNLYAPLSLIGRNSRYGDPGMWFVDRISRNPHWWSIIEWGEPEKPILMDTIMNLIQWPREEGGNEHLYGILPMEFVWQDANRLVSSLEIGDNSAYLATVTSEAENNFISSRVIRDTDQPYFANWFWLGGYFNHNRDYVWVTDEPWLYANWYGGHPTFATPISGVYMVGSGWSPMDPGTWGDYHSDKYAWTYSVVEWDQPSDIDIEVDILPSICPNHIAISPYHEVYEIEGTSQVAPKTTDTDSPFLDVQVAILGSETFDAASITPESLKLAGEYSPSNWSLIDISQPGDAVAVECSCGIYEGDGYIDLVVSFHLNRFIKTDADIRVGDELYMPISGRLSNGRKITGGDRVILMGRNWKEDDLQDQPELIGNYPNPFNPTTEISYSLPEASRIKLEIFNILGQKVITLVDQYVEAGSHTSIWDSRDHNGQTVASGIYLYRLQTSSYTETKKMMLLK